MTSPAPANGFPGAAVYPLLETSIFKSDNSEWILCAAPENANPTTPTNLFCSSDNSVKLIAN
jgi:hypothetical protein